MRFAFPQWKGFEFAPEGHLLEQLVDLSGSMGIAYERSVGFYKRLHAHDRPMIVLPRGSCVMKVRTADTAVHYDVEAASFLIVPRGVRHGDEGLTSIFDTVALYPSRRLLEQVAEEEGIPAAALQRFFGRCQKLPRSHWLEQLIQEYFFARVLVRRSSARTVAFLERQILVEVLASAPDRRRAAPPPRAVTSEDNVTNRALRYIESNLFSKLPLAAIARQAFASSSTLLRRFREDTGRTPHAYVAARRMDEARRLIKVGLHPVGHVAVLVGYENIGAFSTAFRRHFGKPPSAFQRGPRRAPARPRSPQSAKSSPAARRPRKATRPSRAREPFASA